jgi:pimeloyl-ACP methyl ester carboxylesterase
VGGGCAWNGVPFTATSHRLPALTLNVLSTHGEGPAAVFVHAPSSHAHSWLPAVSRLAGVRAICPDLRGHGWSDRGPGYRLADYAADVRSLVEALPDERVDLVAPSLGGRVAALAAAGLGDRVRTLVLLDSAPSLPAAALARIAATRAGVARRTEFRSEAEVVAFWAAQHPTWTSEALTVRARHLYGGTPLRSRNDPAIARLFGTAGEDEAAAVWSALSRVRARVVVVRGRESPLLDRATARRVAETPRAGELLEVPGGHYLPYEQPDALATLLGGVLARTRGSHG